MPRPWQRIAACTAAGLLTLLLCGCDVHGTVDVKSATQAEANLIFTEAEVDCLGLTRYAGLVIKGTPESDGHQTCRAQGTIDLDSLKDFGIKLSQTGEYLMLDLAMPEQFGYMPTKVDITFPGKVLDGGGSTVSGNSIQLNELSGAASPGRSRVVALSHAGPEWWVMALIAGFGGGVVLTVLVLLLVRRHRHLRETLQVDADQLPADATTPETGVAPPTNPAAMPDASFSEPMRDADYDALFAPPKPGTVAAVPRQPAEPPPPPEATTPADHEIWAKPEDRGDR
jgi:hypothetical protein